MANKKRAKKLELAQASPPKAETEEIAALLTPEDLAARAWPVASIINLENVIAEEFHIKRSPEGYLIADEILINLETSAIGIGKKEDQKKLSLKIPMIARATKKSVPESSEPAVFIACTFVLIYSIQTFDGLTDDQFAAFAQTSGIFSLWPYWRQAIHAASLTLGLPPIILPTHRMHQLNAPPSTEPVK